MKKFKTSTSLLLAVFFAVGTSVMLTSCQATESATETVAKKETSPGAQEMKSFEIALQNLNSKANREARASNKKASIQDSLLEDSKNLIYSTGISEDELLAKCGNDGDKIISLALQIHSENANGKLKL